MHFFWKVPLLFLLLHQTSNAQRQCGYKSCPLPKPGVLNVHIVCHTHLDTGWVETYDEYYQRYVRDILDSVIENLYQASNRKFIFVETSYFSRWWNEQNETIKNRVQWLISTGQLEFISGGWSMNDEANPRYQQIIDELTYGHRWLNRTFGECAKPNIGWQIDPFGHSREHASLLAQMSFDGLFLGRIDYQDKVQRQKTKSMEFIWKSSPSLGNKADIFTGVLPNVYWTPSGFCYDMNCYDEEVHEFNAERRARAFIDLAKEQSKTYLTNHTIMTMGMDFFFRDAKKWYSNLDKLISAVNSLTHKSGVHVYYSTPSCYLKALHEAMTYWPVKLDDFFPYADAYNTYWSGYFTSRPALKLHIEHASNVLQAAKQLAVLANLDRTMVSKVDKLQEDLGIMMHHDAITGTSKQYVVEDFNRILASGVVQAEEVISRAFQQIWLQEGIVLTSKLTFCHKLNISECHIMEQINDVIEGVVVMYNPIAHAVKHYVSLPIIGSGFRVRDSLGNLIPSQIVPNHAITSKLPTRTSESQSSLVFRTMLPPLGFTTFTVDKVDPNAIPLPNQMSQVFESPEFYNEASISNGRLSAIVDGETGLLTAVILKDGRRVDIRQNFFVYQSEGRFTGEKPSGAYAFNPSDYGSFPASDKATFKVIRGPLVEEIHQSFTPWISQTIRIYQQTDYIEFDWVVGPIPVDNWSFYNGQEVTTKFTTSFKTNGTFFTDANGRETLRRVRDYRPTWNLNTTEKAASNYYPVTSWMFIRDYALDLQFTLLPDRPQGGSSLQDGALELMVHRRLLRDDGFGMDEALNELGEDYKGLVVRGKHKLFINDPQESIRQMRIMSKSLNNMPILAFREKRNTVRNVNSFRQPSTPVDRETFVGITRKLPANIHLLTLEPWDDGRILIRLEHFFEVNEDPVYSRPRRISLKDLFSTFNVEYIEETTLNGMQNKRMADFKRLRWLSLFNPYANYTNVLTEIVPEDLETTANDPYAITLYPMEIRSFLVTISRRKL